MSQPPAEAESDFCQSFSESHKDSSHKDSIVEGQRLNRNSELMDFVKRIQPTP
jgi:hypothetical protein